MFKKPRWRYIIISRGDIRLPDMGIWRGISIRGYDAARLDDVYITYPGKLVAVPGTINDTEEKEIARYGSK